MMVYKLIGQLFNKASCATSCSLHHALYLRLKLHNNLKQSFITLSVVVKTRHNKKIIPFHYQISFAELDTFYNRKISI